MATLTYVSAWRPIQARISGLENAARVHAAFLVSHSGSPYGADKALQIQCASIRENIERYRDSFHDLLPDAALIAIESFMDDGGKQILGNGAGDALLVRTIIVKLVAFESELTFYLNNQLERVRSASELAFLHLQRLIVVDEDYRKKWQAAQAAHETHCEKLGAVHLMWHGVWAFKVDASGGKTDLVYQEPPQFDVAPVALGVVLTEWKRTDDNPEPVYKAAKLQADHYSSGVLAGLELTSHRYLVVVTKKQKTPPADILEGGVVYRHINIAVEPDSPSVAAKRLVTA